jgi:localization factor PodJL
VTAAAPWSVKGIDPKAREVAKDLARRSGMTLGEWLNSMIMEDNDDEDVVPLARRPHVEVHERRGRSRRLEDAYGVSDETVQRLGASIEAIAARLEASERRATVAIQGVDQAVGGLVRRLDGGDAQAQEAGRRIDDIAQELREGHRRLRRFEQETGPQTAESFAKIESGLGGLASRLYDIEERQRSGVAELRQRLDQVEKTQPAAQGADILTQVGARLDDAQARTTEALRRLERSFGDLDARVRLSEGRVEPDGARFEKLAESLSRQVENSRVEMLRRLDTAETENRIDRIDRAVAAMADQARAAEQRSAAAVEAMGREIMRIARNLDERLEQVEKTADGAGAAELGQALSARIDRDFARHTQVFDQRLAASDDRHAQAIERLGGEITRISDRLSERIAQSERRSAEALEDIGRRLVDRSEKIEQRHDRASGELAERMRQSEERTARLLAEARDSIERRNVRPAEPPVADWRAAAFPDDAFQPAAATTDWSRDPLTEDAPEPFPAGLEIGDDLDVFVNAADTPQAEAPAQPEEPEADDSPAPPPFGVASPAPPTADLVIEDDFDTVEPAFEDDAEFVDREALRAAAAAGRAASQDEPASTLDAVQAARAAMTTPEAESRSGFGLKRGGKSQLQQRLDRQAARDGSTVRKALVASTLAVAVTAGGYGYARVAGEFGLPLPAGWADAFEDATAPAPDGGAPMAALASSATAATPALDPAEGANLYARAARLMEEGDPTALETLKRAANLGYPTAQMHLANLYLEGRSGAPIDKPEARLWARRAAEGGDAKGMHNYAMYLYDGLGGPANRQEAVDWLKKAAEQGFVDSQYNLGKMYEDGQDVTANAGEALKWYAIAARGGDGQAQAALDRLTPAATPQARQAARRAADEFQAAPLKG